VERSSLRHYLTILRRQAWLIVLVPAVALLVTAVVVSQQKPVYRASMKMVVGQAGSQFQPAITTQSLTQTMTNLLESEVVAQTALEKLGLDDDPAKVVKKLRTAVRPDSSVVEVTYDRGDKEEAVAILSGIASAFESLVAERLLVRPEAGTGGATGSAPLFFARTFDPPHLEPNQVSPHPVKNLAFAGVLGLVLGLAFAFVRENLDDRIRSRRDAEDSFGAPVIGVLPTGVEEVPAYGLEAQAPERNKVAEAVNLLSASVQFSRVGRLRGPVIVVTSVDRGEGKSATAANLATSLALAGQRVVCIDADLRNPVLHEYFAQDGDQLGWAHLLRGDVDAADVSRKITLRAGALNGTATHGNGSEHRRPGGAVQFAFVAAGPESHSVADVFGSAEVERALSALRVAADFVIVNAPPLFEAGDTLALALHADTVLVVAREGRTTRAGAEEGRQILSELGADRVAVVLTRRSRRTGGRVRSLSAYDR
jgi:tyrosine-protein kinase